MQENNPQVPFGVYVHFPYCRKRCPYCDFAVAVRKDIPHERYLRAVLDELSSRARLFPGRRAVSVYFGGGTPSLWEPRCIAAVRRAVLDAFPSPAPFAGGQPEVSAPLPEGQPEVPAPQVEVPAEGPEVTVEADPKDLTQEVLLALREAGVNRLSLGVQSLEERHLLQLGRLHTSAESITAVTRARGAGFSNLSLDLMIGLCGQQRGELLSDLSGFVALRPEHLSIYQLTVEPRTTLAARVRKGMAHLPDTDVQADYYVTVQETLARAGYEQYEISSFALRGDRITDSLREGHMAERPDLPDLSAICPRRADHRAVHNRLYWTGGEYLGLGVSAHSFRRSAQGSGERFANSRDLTEYLATEFAMGRTGDAEEPLSQGEPGLALYEHLDREAVLREALWLGLRQLAGISLSAFASLHGVCPLESHGEAIAGLQKRGLLLVEGDVLRLSQQGVLFADEVGAQLL